MAIMKIEKIHKDIDVLDEILNFNVECVSIFGSARFEEDNEFCKKAQDLAQNLANMGYGIVTGGGGGIMQAANKGAFSQNYKKSFGFNIVLPREQKCNNFLGHSALFSTLCLRKFALITKSKAFVVFPGGFGTLDELFEIVTLAQTGFKDAKIYLFDQKFWAPLIEFCKVSLLKENAITKDELNRLKVVDSIDEIIKDLKKK